MSIDRLEMAVAGAFILFSFLLAHYLSANLLWFTAFVGVNVMQSAFTGFCPMAIVLQKLGVKPGHAFN